MRYLILLFQGFFKISNGHTHHAIFNRILEIIKKIWDIIVYNNVRYQMAARVMRYLILLFQGFLKYQMAACVTRYLI